MTDIDAIDFDDDDARRIAADLTGKYGRDALDYVAARAERAGAIGDAIAQTIWQRVLAAADEMLRR